MTSAYLEELGDKSHVYHAPIPFTPSRDPLNRGGPSTPIIQPIDNSMAVQVSAVSKSPGLYRVRLVLNDGRDTFSQEGYADEVISGRAEGGLQSGKRGELRLPYKVVTQAAPPGPDVTLPVGRLVSAEFKGQLLAAFGQGVGNEVSSVAPKLFGEVSGAMTALGSWAPGVKNIHITCMLDATINGVETLLVGYAFGNVNDAGGTGLQAFTGIAAVPTAVTAGPAVWGLAQAPNGDLIANINGDLKLALSNVAPGALAFNTVLAQAMRPTGYAIGNVNLSNYYTGVAWWEPLDATQLDSSGTIAGGGMFAGSLNIGQSTPRGRVSITPFDLRRKDPIDFDLPFVTFCSPFQDGLVACDRITHQQYTGRSMYPMTWQMDRSVDSDKVRLCCGHARLGDRFFWLENEVDLCWDDGNPDSAKYTVCRIMEYDAYLRKVRPASKDFLANWGGHSYHVGAMPELPVSSATNQIYAFGIQKALGASDAGNWHRQYQHPSSLLGYGQRRTEGASTSGGALFEANDYLLSAALVIRGLEGARFVHRRTIFTGDVDAGGATDGATPARVTVAIEDAANANREIHSDTFRVRQKRTQVARRRPNRGVCYKPQIRITLAQESGTGHDGYKTPNGYGLIIEFDAYLPGLSVPTDYTKWDTDADGA